MACISFAIHQPPGLITAVPLTNGSQVADPGRTSAWDTEELLLVRNNSNALNGMAIKDTSPCIHLLNNAYFKIMYKSFIVKASPPN